MSPTMAELKKMLMTQQGLDPARHEHLPEADNIRDKEARRFSAEATLRSLEWPLSPKEVKTCKDCGNNFLTEYHSVAYCNDLCRKSTLAKYGIDWRNEPLKRSYGGMTPPGIITPDALEAMATILRQANYTVLNPHVVEVALPEDSEKKEQPQTQQKNEIQHEPEIKPDKEDSGEFDFFDF